jgi:hypothetical protein
VSDGRAPAIYSIPDPHAGVVLNRAILPGKQPYWEEIVRGAQNMIREGAQHFRTEFTGGHLRSCLERVLCTRDAADLRRRPKSAEVGRPLVAAQGRDRCGHVQDDHHAQCHGLR